MGSNLPADKMKAKEVSENFVRNFAKQVQPELAEFWKTAEDTTNASYLVLLRDLFAVAAMVSLGKHIHDITEDDAHMAVVIYHVADAMMEARKKGNTDGT